MYSIKTGPMFGDQQYPEVSMPDYSFKSLRTVRRTWHLQNRKFNDLKTSATKHFSVNNESYHSTLPSDSEHSVTRENGETLNSKLL